MKETKKKRESPSKRRQSSEPRAVSFAELVSGGFEEPDGEAFERSRVYCLVGLYENQMTTFCSPALQGNSRLAGVLIFCQGDAGRRLFRWQVGEPIALRFLATLLADTERIKVMWNAKDLFKGLFDRGLPLEQTAARVYDPGLATWLLDPNFRSSCDFGTYIQEKHPDILAPTKSTLDFALFTEKCIEIMVVVLMPLLREQQLWEAFESQEMRLVPILAAMESHGIQINLEGLRNIEKMLEDRMKELEVEVKPKWGAIKLRSSKQVSSVLWPNSSTAQSTSKEELRKLRATTTPELGRFIDIVVEYRLCGSVCSHHITPFLEQCPGDTRNKKAALVKPRWMQTSCRTGRLSCVAPNLQNISKSFQCKGHTVNLRDSFQASAGNVFLSFDYISIELRLLAHFSESPMLTQLLHDCRDVFSMLACDFFKMEQVDETKRRHTKAILYGIIYGSGVPSLASKLGIDLKTAADLRSQFLTHYDLQEYIKRAEDAARLSHSIVTISGRRRSLPELSAENPQQRAAATRQVVNSILQGSAADAIKLAMIQIYTQFGFGSDLQLVLQIHDELLFECPEHRKDFYAPQIRAIMENVAQQLKLRLPLPVTAQYGYSYGSLQDFKEN